MKYTNGVKEKFKELDKQFEIAKKSDEAEKKVLIEKLRGEIRQYSIYQKLCELRGVLNNKKER